MNILSQSFAEETCFSILDQVLELQSELNRVNFETHPKIQYFYSKQGEASSITAPLVSQGMLLSTISNPDAYLLKGINLVDYSRRNCFLEVFSPTHHYGKELQRLEYNWKSSYPTMIVNFGLEYQIVVVHNRNLIEIQNILHGQIHSKTISTPAVKMFDRTRGLLGYRYCFLGYRVSKRQLANIESGSLSAKKFLKGKRGSKLLRLGHPVIKLNQSSSRFS